MNPRRFDLIVTTTQYAFLRLQVMRLWDARYKALYEKKRRPEPKVAAMAALHKKLVVKTRTFSGEPSTTTIGLTRKDCRILQEMLTASKSILENQVLPGYIQRISALSPADTAGKQKTQAYYDKAKDTLDFVCNPVLNSLNEFIPPMAGDIQELNDGQN